MRFKQIKIAVFALFVATLAFGQQQQTSPAPAPNPITGTSRTPMEQKGYDDAMRENEQAKQKAEVDRVKAQQEADAKRRSSLIIYSAVDRASQEIMQSQKKPMIKEAKKLLLHRQNILKDLQATDARLQELEKQIVAVDKVRGDN